MGKVKYLERDTFQGLTKLQYLDISILGTELEYVEAGILSSVPKLVSLEVNYGLNYSTLNNITKNATLSNVVTLDIRFNDLGAIKSDTLEGFTGLRSLFIDSSNLDYIDSNAFSPFGKTIESIQLMSNDLKELPFDLFDIQPGRFGRMDLTISLNKNSLQALPAGIFDKAILNRKNITIDLNDNEWVCDCDLAWLQELILNDTIYLKGGEETKCKGPDPNKGKSLETADFSMCSSINSSTTTTIPTSESTTTITTTTDAIQTPTQPQSTITVTPSTTKKPDVPSTPTTTSTSKPTTTTEPPTTFSTPDPTTNNPTSTTTPTTTRTDIPTQTPTTITITSTTTKKPDVPSTPTTSSTSKSTTTTEPPVTFTTSEPSTDNPTSTTTTKTTPSTSTNTAPTMSTTTSTSTEQPTPTTTVSDISTTYKTTSEPPTITTTSKTTTDMPITTTTTRPQTETMPPGIPTTTLIPTSTLETAPSATSSSTTTTTTTTTNSTTISSTTSIASTTTTSKTAASTTTSDKTTTESITSTSTPYEPPITTTITTATSIPSTTESITTTNPEITTTTRPTTSPTISPTEESTVTKTTPTTTTYDPSVTMTIPISTTNTPSSEATSTDPSTSPPPTTIENTSTTESDNSSTNFPPIFNGCKGIEKEVNMSLIYPTRGTANTSFEILNLIIEENDEENTLIIKMEHGGYTLFWMNIDNTKEINCNLTPFKHEPCSSPYFIAKFKTDPSINYTLCALSNNGDPLNPLNCRAYTTLPYEDDRAWLVNGEKILICCIFGGAILICFFAGGILIYIIVRRHPRLIKGNKRVIVVRHRAGDVMVMPKEYYYATKGDDYCGFRRNSETSYYTARTSSTSYVTAIQPTPVQLIAWKFNRMWNRLTPDSKKHDIEKATSNEPPPLPPHPKDACCRASCEMNYPYDSNSCYTTVVTDL
ncbi:hypothetical protein C0J52_08058 [Blattella germanica]|nr:hypothetical protein C0J52_08058 [Blattella germanica]